MNPDEMPTEPPDGGDRNWPDFQRELKDLINRHSMELPSNTADHVLAEYLVQCLVAYNIAIASRGQEDMSNVVTLR